MAEFLAVTPSPNGEWLTLSWGLSKQGKASAGERLLLVNRKGEVVEVGMAGK